MKLPSLSFAALLAGVIAGVSGCGDATLVGVGAPPAPPETRPVASPSPVARLDCVSLPDASGPQTVGPRSIIGPTEPSQPTAKPNSLGSSPQSRSLQIRRRSNYAVAW